MPTGAAERPAPAVSGVAPPRGLRAAVGGLPRTFWTLWAGMLVNRTASFVLLFLGLYLTSARGLGAAEAGRIVSLYGIGVLAAGPLGGLVADAVGRRFTMALGLTLGAAAVASLMFLRSPWALGVATLWAALFGEMYRPAAQAVVADVVPLADRQRAYGLVYWAINLGFTLGLMLAAVLAQRSWVALFLCDAGTSLLFAAVVLFMLPETRPPAAAAESALRGLVGLFRDRDLVALLVLHFLALVVFNQFELALPLDMQAHGLGARGYALLVSINGLGVIILQPLLGSWLARFDTGRLLAASAALFGAGFGLNALVSTPAGYGTGVALWTVGEVVGFPCLSRVIADLSPAHMRGRYQGAFTMAMGLAFSVSSLAGGLVLSRFGARTLWLACLALGLAVAAGHLAIAPARRRRFGRAA